MVAEPGGVPGDERVAAVPTLRRLCVDGAGVLVPLLDWGEFGRQGPAQHDDLAKIVAARLLPLEPLQASCFAFPHAVQLGQHLVEWTWLGIVGGFPSG
jgi:hypothetical protein